MVRPVPDQPTLLRVIEAIRRHNGYAMPRTGSRLHAWATSRLPTAADVELLPGVRAHLDLTQPVQVTSWWQGRRYERPTTEILDEWARGAACFFDIGANYGFFALRSATAGCPAVHAFEPNPNLYAQLAATCERNHLANLHAHQLGIAATDGQLELNIGHDLGHSSFGPRDWEDNQPVTVEVTSFDRWLEREAIELPTTPTWVAKIDVEGFEREVLVGMQRTLEHHAFRSLVVELNELTLQACGTSGREIVALLAAAGYRESRPRAGEPGLENAFFSVTHG